MTDETDTERPMTTATLLAQARSDNFTNVTNAGKKCAASLKEMINAGPEEMVKEIRKVMPSLLQTLISVTFEKAKIWPTLESNPSLSYYTNLDFDSWMNPGDLNKSQLEKAQVN